MDNVIDLSTLKTINRDATHVFVLVSGERLIAQKIHEDAKAVTVERPVRVIVRPMPGGQVGVDFVDFLLGAHPDSKDRAVLKASAELCRYSPAEELLRAYADHISKVSPIGRPPA